MTTIEIKHERNVAVSGPELDRRDALRLLAGGMAVALGSCGPPDEQIVPYVELPERVTPGVPLQFATTLPLAGYGRGVLATSYEGRLTKIEGNPRHPASLGATDVFAQAATMTLYDPNRSKAVRGPQGVSSWTAFTSAWITQLSREREAQGAGLRILTGRVTSPTMIRQMNALLAMFPGARWSRYEPVDDDAERAGAMLAYGRVLTSIPDLSQVSVLVTLDADPIGPGPAQVRHGHEFSQVRQSAGPAGRFLRLYAIEPTWTLTGANADERLALPPQLIRNAALAIANGLGVSLPEGMIPQGTLPEGILPDHAREVVRLATADLKANPGRAMVLAGRGQPPAVHALCHWINAQLKAPISLIAPVDPVEASHRDSLTSLADDLANNRVTSLFILGANPAYATPGGLKFAELIRKAAFRAHLGLYEDETAAQCPWHLPCSHTLESWSDIRAVEGTASIIQPLIRPLYDTRTSHHVLALIGGRLSSDPYQEVRESWRAQVTSGFEDWWRHGLHDGVLPDTVSPPVDAGAPRVPEIMPAERTQGLTLTVAPDPSIWDGRFSPNAWLQECPKPVTTQVWGNALLISPDDAAAHALHEGDLVRLSRGELGVEAPVLIHPGQANGVVSTTLGYGRAHAGPIGGGLGFDVHPLLTADDRWATGSVSLTPLGKRGLLLRTQHHFELEGDAKDLFPTVNLGELPSASSDPPDRGEELPTLLPGGEGDARYKWGMVIDTSVCIGCNACVVACQAENNVPVVGPAEIGVGRDMHWLRIDTYVVRGEDRPPGFQPVPCMQCEHAPCEPVCPVEASVHDSQGLNVQVYNRCVGTRFCESNCPYKVRRFNFFGYSYDQAYANLGQEVTKAHFNPDVTVRARGVMEKCTYCIQRIMGARRHSDEQDVPIPTDSVVTACQAACPTRAITFGNLNDESAAINRRRNEPHHYALLGHLGTRPRTTYLARLRNPNPELGGRRS